MRKAPFFVATRHEKGAFSAWMRAVTRPAPHRLRHRTICIAVQPAVYLLKNRAAGSVPLPAARGSAPLTGLAALCKVEMR